VNCRRLYVAGLLLVLSWNSTYGAAPTPAKEDPQLVDARQRMVREDVIAAGIRNDRVCAAIRNTPRHLFVPEVQRPMAYVDAALPIGAGQTISPPYVVARMTEQLDPQPQDKVLEIGTGSGYQAAVLSALVAEVYTIEIVESLGTTAAHTLHELQYQNVHTRIGDGYQGWPEAAPFDKIIVTCSPERVPDALVAQLREGGRMVIPLGERYQQTLCLLRKTGGRMQSEIIEPTFFVPMTGRAEEVRQKKGDAARPELVNGDFESSAADEAPAGWYYARQARVVSDSQAPSGKCVLRFSNATPGRNAQALQSVAVDGRRVREIELTVWVKTDRVRPGPLAGQMARLGIVFFDDQRAAIGSSELGPWLGTGHWRLQRMKAKVPQESRLAGLAVGLFGATGQLSIDRLALEAVDAGPP
jgi:protein-L-isoaspartate(D-aspartate) O-methyltransferase